jgi:hypothetical protein
MKQKKGYKKNSTARKVKEPAVAYNVTPNKSISVFNSFEEAEEDNYTWLASLTGEQHLQNAVALIKRIYAEDLKKHPTIGTTLIIGK